MGPPPLDPISAIGEGVGWTTALAKKIAKLHREKKLRLIERKDNYQIAKETEASEPFKLYRRYIRNPAVLSWASTGLILGRMETDPVRRKDVQFIRDRLRRTQGMGALHVAELAQSSALDHILVLVGSGNIHIPPTKTMDNVLSEIDQYAVFVRESDDEQRRATDTDVQTLALAPFVFIVLGRWTASEKAARIIERMAPAMYGRGYSLTKLVDAKQAVGVFYKH